MKSTVLKLEDWYFEKRFPIEDDEIFILMTAIIICKNNVRLASFVATPITPNRHEMIVKYREEIWNERLNSVIDYVKKIKGYNDLRRKKGDSIFETKKARSTKAYKNWLCQMRLQYNEESAIWTDLIKTKVSLLNDHYPAIV